MKGRACIIYRDDDVVSAVCGVLRAVGPVPTSAVKRRVKLCVERSSHPHTIDSFLDVLEEFSVDVMTMRLRLQQHDLAIAHARRPDIWPCTPQLAILPPSQQALVKAYISHEGPRTDVVEVSEDENEETDIPNINSKQKQIILSSLAGMGADQLKCEILKLTGKLSSAITLAKDWKTTATRRLNGYNQLAMELESRDREESRRAYFKPGPEVRKRYCMTTHGMYQLAVRSSFGYMSTLSCLKLLLAAVSCSKPMTRISILSILLIIWAGNGRK